MFDAVSDPNPLPLVKFFSTPSIFFANQFFEPKYFFNSYDAHARFFSDPTSQPVALKKSDLIFSAFFCDGSAVQKPF